MWDPDTLRAKNDARAEQLRELKAARLRLKEWLGIAATANTLLTS